MARSFPTAHGRMPSGAIGWQSGSSGGGALRVRDVVVGAGTADNRQGGSDLQLDHLARTATLSAAALALAVAGCGTGDDTEQEGTQPAPAVSTFEQGRFDELPLPPEAEPVGPRSEKEGIVTRSYRVPGKLPRDVIEYYQGALREQGWTQLDVEDLAEGRRGDWTIEGWDLRVSASDATGLAGDDDQPTTQLSLVLSPASATTIPDE